MIRRLRRRHLGTWSVLVVVLPVILAIALLGRAPLPIAAPPSWSTALTPPSSSETSEWPGTPILITVGEDPAGHSMVHLNPIERVVDPDLLVYWLPDGQSSLSSGFLLGTFDGLRPQTYRLPPAASREPGGLRLFSLAHGNLVAQTDLQVPMSD